jgi:hypothetical protein
MLKIEPFCVPILAYRRSLTIAYLSALPNPFEPEPTPKMGRQGKEIAISGV